MSNDDILETIEAEGYSRIPVYADTKDNIIGILHTRDYLLKHTRPDFKLEDVMFSLPLCRRRRIWTHCLRICRRSTTISSWWSTSTARSAGIVTMEDILEEIVGEIWDERDEAVEDIVQIDESTYRVLCSTNIEDFFEFFNLEPVEDIEATTVNGWMTEQIGSVSPAQGYTFDYANLAITVTKADDLMAHEIVVRVNEKAENEAEEAA